MTWHSCMTHHDKSFVFECQVFQMSQVCPVFQSRSLCQDFHIHRLPPLVSHSPPKTKKQIFYKFVRSFHRFVGRVVFKFMFFFYDTEGGTRWRKEKNRSVVPPTLKVRYLFLIFFFYTNTPMYMECEYIHRYISYVYIYTYIYVCICVCPCIIWYVYGCIYGFRHSYVYMRTWSMYFWRSSHEFERVRK